MIEYCKKSKSFYDMTYMYDTEKIFDYNVSGGVIHRRRAIGLRVYANGDTYIGVASCSPKDQFSRRIARNIINGRIDKYIAGRNMQPHVKTVYMDQLFEICDKWETPLPADYIKVCIEKAKLKLKNYLDSLDEFAD